MITKYSTGDKVLIEATITTAEVFNGKVLYGVKECDVPVQEKSIVSIAGTSKDSIPSVIKVDVNDPTYKHTAELTEELMHREGVTAIEAGPSHRFSIEVDGPATVLIVYD